MDKHKHEQWTEGTLTQNRSVEREAILRPGSKERLWVVPTAAENKKLFDDSIRPPAAAFQGHHRHEASGRS